MNVDEIIDEIGRSVSGPSEWAAVAMECLDQAMLPCSVQDQIAEIIRQAGVGLPVQVRS